MRTLWIAGASASLLFLHAVMGVARTTAPAPSIELKRDDRQGQLAVLVVELHLLVRQPIRLPLLRRTGKLEQAAKG